MKIKTSELKGSALNWAVAKSEGHIDNPDSWLYQALETDTEHYYPSTSWSIAGPIIEREQLTVEPIYWKEELTHWSAYGHSLKYDEQGEYIEGSDHKQTGPTPLIATMRSYVASKLGDEVEIPEEPL